VLKTLDGTGVTTAEEELFIAGAKCVVADLHIEFRGRVMRALLKQRFGDLPPPGAKRGEYFKDMKRSFPDWGMQSLATKLLRDEPLQFADLATAFPNVRLSEARQRMDGVAGEVRRVCLSSA
jgi:hypothetical protein